MSMHLINGMAVEDAGAGQVVVCVHGLGGTSNTWSSLIPAFQGFRLIRIDLPGCGRSVSETSGINIPELQNSLISICKALSIESAQWVGHSMGTIVCQHLAQNVPSLVKSLLLFGPLTEPAESAREPLRTRAEKVRTGGLTGMQETADALLQTAVAQHTKDHNPAAFAFVRESLMRQSPKSYADYCMALSQARSANIALIQAPTLLVTGDEDRVASVEAVDQMCRRMPNAKRVVFNRCGHWTPIEKPHECIRVARDFLKRHA